ncbi:MAG TPA: hypothetical protein VFC63_26255 [Blastocatellia bacterium]|nr:hypothetical protein [Blastocatellia bacterium]
MEKTVAEITQEIYGGPESNAAKDSVESATGTSAEPDPDQIRKALENLTGIWSDRFKDDKEAIEYANKIRRTGGRPRRH